MISKDSLKFLLLKRRKKRRKEHEKLKNRKKYAEYRTTLY